MLGACLDNVGGIHEQRTRQEETAGGQTYLNPGFYAGPPSPETEGGPRLLWHGSGQCSIMIAIP
jgi:hypothetical protein